MRKFYKIFLAIISLIMLIGCAAKPENIYFNQLVRPNKPNYYLMCPKGKCNVESNITSPCFDASREQLVSVWKQMIKDQPRYSLLIDHKYYKQYIQRSYLFRFPDYVTVQFYALNDHSSTIALLSFAKYGYYDFDVNQDRVTGLLNQLYETLPLCNVNDSAM